MCASSTFGKCVRREELKRRSIHAFYVRSRRRELKQACAPPWGSLMCCGRINMGPEDEETAENARAREKEPRGRARHQLTSYQAPSCGRAPQ